jgi:DAK2 domain fusion protein YloV
MTALERLDAVQVEHAVRTFRDALRSHQRSIDALNVFPVPDGDTGTNMTLTIEAVVAELESLEGGVTKMAEVWRAIAHGSLMGARGNSGVMLCQILRGMSEEALRLESLGPEEMAACLERGSEAAYESVARPVEGTILTVARAAASAAVEASRTGQTLLGVLEAAREAASSALASTPEMLPVLKEAGVVDAGGAGFVLLVDSLLAAVDGRQVPEPEEPRHPPRAGPPLTAGARYEVMFLLETRDELIAAFKEAWARLGDSVAVVGGGGLWNCHVHTGDIGGALEAALEVGRPRAIRVTDLDEQQGRPEERPREAPATAASGQPPPPPEPQVVTAAVAVATGEGVVAILRSLGVRELVAGGQSMNPSTAQILEAVEAAPAREVVVLPNNDNILPAARQVSELTSKEVRVIATSDVAQAFAALLAYDPSVGAEQNAESMEAAAARVVSGEVTRAARPSRSRAGGVAQGDWVGLSGRGVEVVADSLVGAACGLLEALLDERRELVTLIEGDGASAEQTSEIRRWLEENYPGVSVEAHRGGQPLYPYMVSVE